MLPLTFIGEKILVDLLLAVADQELGHAVSADSKQGVSKESRQIPRLQLTHWFVRVLSQQEIDLINIRLADIEPRPAQQVVGPGSGPVLSQPLQSSRVSVQPGGGEQAVLGGEAQHDGHLVPPALSDQFLGGVRDEGTSTEV